MWLVFEWSPPQILPPPQWRVPPPPHNTPHLGRGKVALTGFQIGGRVRGIVIAGARTIAFIVRRQDGARGRLF